MQGGTGTIEDTERNECALHAMRQTGVSTGETGPTFVSIPNRRGPA